MAKTDYARAQWKAAADFKRGRHINGEEVEVHAIILHSTDGSEAGDIETLTQHHDTKKRSCHYYVTKLGKVYQFVLERDTAYHAGVVYTPETEGNAVTIGIEQEHKDGMESWPDAQIRATAGLVADIRKRYGCMLPVYSHAAVAKPRKRKQDPKNYPWSTLTQYVKEYSI